MALSSQNLPHKTVQWSMCLNQSELFSRHIMMSHLPIEFSLLPPNCRRNLIGYCSNLYSDKVAEWRKKEKKKKAGFIWRLQIVFFFHNPVCAGPHSQYADILQTTITPSRFPISSRGHPKVHSSFPLLPKPSLKSPVCDSCGLTQQEAKHHTIMYSPLSPVGEGRELKRKKK